MNLLWEVFKKISKMDYKQVIVWTINCCGGKTLVNRPLSILDTCTMYSDRRNCVVLMIHCAVHLVILWPSECF